MANYEKYKDWTADQLKDEIKRIEEGHEFMMKQFEKCIEDRDFLKQTLNYITKEKL